MTAVTPALTVPLSVTPTPTISVAPEFNVKPVTVPPDRTIVPPLLTVVPLAKALRGHGAWITGLKRVDTPERAEAPVIAWDPSRNMVKVNPVAAWDDDDVDAYVAAHDLPRHPLNYVGYVSIGCAPTTVPVPEGHHPREGRWAGTGKTECGLHV